MAPLVSIVCLCFNRQKNVVELLSALSHQTYPAFEIILVDNGSTDGTTALVRREFPEVRIVENGTNLGMVGYNRGFEIARGEFVLVMDDDGVPVSDDWVKQIVECFETDPKIGVVGCTIRMRDTGKIAYDSPQYLHIEDGLVGYPGVAYNGTGAGIRTSALQQAGFYPEYFFRTYLELHLCSRIVNCGWRVRQVPSIEVWHSRPSGSSNPQYSYYGCRNYYWYVWELYPFPYCIVETMHQLGSRIKLVLQRKITIRLYLKAVKDAFLGISQVLSYRNPISTETLRYLRWIRRHPGMH